MLGAAELRLGEHNKHLMDQLHKGVATMDLDLTYDRLGNRLRAIGDVQITYGRMGNRPRTLGQWTLEYHNLGNRLRAIGGVQITYGRMGNRPRTLGQWTLEYSRLGNLQCIGPYQVGADWIGNRLRTIGPLTIFYDRMGNRPARVHLPDEYRPQWNGLLLALFLMLYQDMKAYQEAGMRWAAGM